MTADPAISVLSAALIWAALIPLLLGAWGWPGVATSNRAVLAGVRLALAPLCWLGFVCLAAWAGAALAGTAGMATALLALMLTSVAALAHPAVSARLARALPPSHPAPAAQSRRDAQVPAPPRACPGGGDPVAERRREPPALARPASFGTVVPSALDPPRRG